MALLFLAFTLLPFAELYLLIRIGRVVGAGSTLALVIAMGLLGAALARTQGRKVLTEWREALAAGRVPEEGVLGGVLVLVGGLLLITPGVLTDIAGFFCLLPITRRAIARGLSHYLSRKVAEGQVQVHSYGFEWPPRPNSARAPEGAHRPTTSGPYVPPTARGSYVPPHASSGSRPQRRDDVIDTDGEEV